MPHSSPTLYDQLPQHMRYRVQDHADFDRIKSDFVQKHVYQNVGGLISRMQEAGGFEDDLEAFYPKPDYAEACAENGVALVEEGGSWYHFQWSNKTTIPCTDGECTIDIEAFAEKHGLKLDEWKWDDDASDAVHQTEIAADSEPNIREGDVWVIISEQRGNDFTEVCDFLARVARHQGNQDLAADLENDGRTQALFEEFLSPNISAALDTFDSEGEAGEDACNSYRIDADDYRHEIYEHWLVSDNLAYWLEQQGETVARDFADSLTVWGRCTTGQAISMDGVISTIVRDVCSSELDEIVKKVYPNLGSHDEMLAGVPLDMLKALEEGRVSRISIEHTPEWGRNKDETIFSRRWLVQQSGEPAKAWVLAEGSRDLVAGVKDARITPDAPVDVADIKRTLAQGLNRTKTPVKEEAFGTGTPEMTELVKGLARFHDQNKGTGTHVVPDNLAARLETRELLRANYQIETGDVEDMDHDEERGLGFELKGPPGVQGGLWLSLMLTDGDVRDFGDVGEPQVGLLVECIGASGVVRASWGPYNYTPQVGTSDPAELIRRIEQECSGDALSKSASEAWIAEFAAPSPAPQPPSINGNSLSMDLF